MPTPKLSREELMGYATKHLDRLAEFVRKDVPPVVISDTMVSALDLLIRIYGDQAYHAINLARRRVHARNDGKCTTCFKNPSEQSATLCRPCLNREDRRSQEVEAQIHFDLLDTDTEEKN